jgi:hypothetical protein
MINEFDAMTFQNSGNGKAEISSGMKKGCNSSKLKQE